MTNTITVYSKPDCPQCVQTKRILEREGHVFNEVDVTEDAAALARVKELGYLQAPVVETGDDHWSGFRPDKILAL